MENGKKLLAVPDLNSQDQTHYQVRSLHHYKKQKEQKQTLLNRLNDYGISSPRLTPSVIHMLVPRLAVVTKFALLIKANDKGNDPTS